MNQPTVSELVSDLDQEVTLKFSADNEWFYVIEVGMRARHWMSVKEFKQDDPEVMKIRKQEGWDSFRGGVDFSRHMNDPQNSDNPYTRLTLDFSFFSVKSGKEEKRQVKDTMVMDYLSSIPKDRGEQPYKDNTLRYL